MEKYGLSEKTGKREGGRTTGKREEGRGKSTTPPTDPPPARENVPLCQRCGFPVKSKPWGCKNPCPNCGFVYPLGDCSD
jgi:hypothetical protein